MDQIEVLLALTCHYPPTSSEEMVNEKIGVVKHQGSQHCVYLRGNCPRLCVPTHRGDKGLLFIAEQFSNEIITIFQKSFKLLF